MEDPKWMALVPKAVQTTQHRIHSCDHGHLSNYHPIIQKTHGCPQKYFRNLSRVLDGMFVGQELVSRAGYVFRMPGIWRYYSFVSWDCGNSFVLPSYSWRWFPSVSTSHTAHGTKGLFTSLVPDTAFVVPLYGWLWAKIFLCCWSHIRLCSEQFLNFELTW